MSESDNTLTGHVAKVSTKFGNSPRWVSGGREDADLRATFPKGTRLRIVLGPPPFYTYVDAGLDDPPRDAFTEWCWRCDATASETDVGLCGSCRADLSEPT